MFKWPDLPTTDAPVHELADFAELICWESNDASTVSLAKELGRNAENDYSDGVPEEEESEQRFEEVYHELQRRQEACGDGYPFVIGQQGQTIQPYRGTANPLHVVYKYLLLATRLRMDRQRKHTQIDGTLLFEELCAEVGREYFGARSESRVFGTSASAPGFETKINELCKALKEGDGFRKTGVTSAKDGKLDVVVWTPFSDGLPGKLIGFGQCKTGTHYRDTLTQLQPEGFQKKWMLSPFASPPVRMFFISEALALSVPNRYEETIDAGLLFDRCRIVDYSRDVPQMVMERILDWTEGAAVEFGLEPASGRAL